MSNFTVNERISFTKEFREEVLKSCRSKCACCGKKLNMKTMTIEHVVPLSKGGENVKDNLVVLCESCNIKKGNQFVWPSGFYESLDDSDKLKEITDYTRNWSKEHIDISYICQYPTVAEKMSLIMEPHPKYRNMRIPKEQLIYDIVEVKYTSESDIKDKFGVSTKAIERTVVSPNRPYSVYCVQSRLNSSVSSIWTAQVDKRVIDDEEVYTMIISEVYSRTGFGSQIFPRVLLAYINWLYAYNTVNRVLVRFVSEDATRTGVKSVFNDRHYEFCTKTRATQNPITNQLYKYRGYDSVNILFTSEYIE